MQLLAALIYWVVVALWAGVLGVVLFNYCRNPRIFGTARLLLVVIGIDTARNIIENVYFGLMFGGQYGIFPKALVGILQNPSLLIVPKIINIGAACLVLGVLLLRWLPKAELERGRSEQVAADFEHLATRDGLTGLFNRRHFDTLARAEWARFQRYGRPLSLLVIDADKFKSINDRFGHDVGDLVLKGVADTCGASKRETDTVARFGGEEFVMLLPETDEAAACVAAERLRSQIHQHSYVVSGEKLQVTVSIGVAGATLSMSGFETLFKRADEAMYEAKNTGRNRVVRAKSVIADLPKIAAE